MRKAVVAALCLMWGLNGAAEINRVGKVSVFVKDYAPALDWYTRVLGFEGRDLGEYAPGLRWVTVNPKAHPELELVLYKGTPVTQGAILTLYSDDIHKDHRDMVKAGVRFPQPPTQRPYGIEAMFQDLYGQNIVLVQLKTED